MSGFSRTSEGWSTIRGHGCVLIDHTRSMPSLRVAHPLETARGIRIASLLFITVLTIVAAQISVPLPFTAVPLTLQPMVVLLGGLALGSRLGSASQILYLAAGIAGLPVFAASAVLPPGPLRLLGPTGGYLMAYPLAAFVTGYLAERGFDRKLPHVGACDARRPARDLHRRSDMARTLCPHAVRQRRPASAPRSSPASIHSSFPI